MTPLVDPSVAGWLRETFSPDGLCEIEHEARHGGLGYGLVHYAIVRLMRPSRVLAIGSRTGFIPACLAQAVADSGTGRLDFVDANYNEAKDGKAAWDGQGWWTDHRFSHLDPVVDVTLTRTDAFFRKRPVGPTWGYVHIDGGHDYDTVRHDFVQAADRLIDGGVIALHDSHAKKMGVWQLVREVSGQWRPFEFPGKWGLTLLQRQTW